jgi:5'-3' exonuclease
VHYEDLKEYLILGYGARIAHGMEADDALGITQTTYNLDNFDGSIICSIDKDLLTIPGFHWNFVKKEKQIVSDFGALTNFYGQFLIGDNADNIVGCAGIGPKKTAKILAPCETEEELFEAVVNTYLSVSPEKSPDEILTHILQIGRVLKIRTMENEPLWTFPKSKLMEEIGQLFIQQLVVETGPSMEPTSTQLNGTSSSGEVTVPSTTSRAI